MQQDIGIQAKCLYYNEHIVEYLNCRIMEQNKHQRKRSGNMKMGNSSMQHRSNVVHNNTGNGNNNPQHGEDWSNYHNRSLSGNAEQQKK
jgi:hypothetical protein